MKVLILTKSAKHGEYCVAGINLDNMAWVRLVSSDKSTMYALTREMVEYVTGEECRVLDVIDVLTVEEKPLEIQRENVLIDEKYYFEYKATCSADDLERFVCNDRYIFGNCYSYIDKETALECGCSLKLFEVENLELLETTNNQNKTRRKVNFRYNGHYYNGISMTDYEFYNYPLGHVADKAYIVVSIPEDDYNGNYYKFVAKIFIKE